MVATSLLRRAWLILPTLALQLVCIELMPPTPGDVARRLLLIATYGLLAAAVWANRRLWSVRVLAVGLTLNALAIASGYGLMPVAPDTVQAAGLGEKIQGLDVGQSIPRSKDVLMRRSDTALWPITDSIPVRLGGFHNVVSPGDLVIVLGVIAGLVELVLVQRPTGRSAGAFSAV
jgi:hypothetical protein